MKRDYKIVNSASISVTLVLIGKRYCDVQILTIVYCRIEIDFHKSVYTYRQ